MKKFILGILAINTVLVFSNTFGTVELGSKFDLTKKTNEAFKLENETSSRVGVFFEESKDLYLFGNLSTKYVNLLENRNKEDFSYVGLSFDKKVKDNFEISLFGAVKQVTKSKNKEFQKELIRHLVEKQKYREDMNFFEKTDTFKRAGYLDEDDKRNLFSINSFGTINRTKIYFSLAHTSNGIDLDSHRVFSYFETDSILNQGFLNTKLESDYNREKQDPKKIYGSKTSQKDKIAISDNGGSLKGSIKFSSSRLIPNTFFYTEGKFDLKSGILAKNGNRFADIDFNNYFKYTGIENLAIITRANYELKHNRDGNFHSDKNTLRLSGEFNYDTKDLSNHTLIKLENTIDNKKGATSLTNSHEFKNNFEYRPVKELALNFDTHYRNFIGFNATHDTLFSLGYKANGRKSRFLYESTLEVKNRLLGAKDIKNLKNSVMGLTENKLSYVARDFKFEYYLNGYSDYSIIREYKEKKSGKKTEVLTDRNEKEYIAYFNNGLKTNYKKNKISISNELNGAYRISSYDEKHSFALGNKNELKYTLSNMELSTNFDIDYRYNKFSIDEMNNFADYIKNAGYNLFRFYNYREVIETTGKKKTTEIKTPYITEKKLEVKDKPEAVVLLTLSPSIASEIKALDNKLIINPKIKSNIIFEAGAIDEKPIFKKTNTIFDLGIKYIW